MAAKYGHLELVQMLHEWGQKEGWPDFSLQYCNFSGWTCVHYAASGGHKDLLIWLLQQFVLLTFCSPQVPTSFHDESIH